MDTNWHRQGDEPLFPDLLWSRPENRRQAGKLLIIGGNLYGFAAPANAYQVSTKAGIGTARVLLPNALQKTVGKILEHGEFAASTPSGSFSQAALAEWLTHAAWADGVLLAGDLGRNSETAIVIEKLATKYTGQMTITKDAIDYFYAQPKIILERPETTLVLSLAQLQKLLTQAHYPKAVTFGMGLVQLVELLSELTSKYPCNVIVKHLDNILVASNGQVSTTKLAEDQEVWRVSTATQASVWWLQNPSKPFEALTTAVFQQAQPK